MAWATTLGPAMAQIDYRLQENSGCGLVVGDDEQVSYRLDSDRALEWVGEGLREVGIEPGTVLGEDGKRVARALASGRDPRTGVPLVEAKKAVDPRAKLDAAPLVDAVRAAAQQAGKSPAQLLAAPRAVARFGRLQRGVAQQQHRAAARTAAHVDPLSAAYKAGVGELEKVADAAGLRLDDLYEPGVLATAREHKDARVRVGNRGYDLTLDMPKSFSTLVAMADPDTARQLEDAYLDCVRETVTAVEKWAGYAMRGHHGDGKRATRVEGTGLLGWMTVHRTARPVAGQAPDPHLHAHVTFVNMVRNAEKLDGDTDRQWNTIGAGGRDIHRHVKAAGTLVQARLRQVTAQRWGVRWERDPGTGAWEITGVPAGLRQVFSKRQREIETALADRGLDRKNATTEQQKTAAQQSKRAKNPADGQLDLRADWHAQAVAAGVDPGALVAAAMPGPQPRPAPEQHRGMGVDELTAWVFRDETGLTAHRKTLTRADVLAEVLDADAAGVSSLGEAEQGADALLAGELAVPLPAAGAVHLSNNQRYTTTEIVTAERAVLAAATDRFAAGYAVVDEPVMALAMEQFEAANGFELSPEQRAVLARLTGAGHGVDTVVGVAGAGKTTIMAALRAAFEATGRPVAGASTAAVAVANLQTEAGIQSHTVASWLQRIETGEGLDKVAVLVVDEAAMVDDRHTAILLHAAGRSGTKVVLIGDPKQLRAVGVGGTFAAVHTMIGGLELSENRRQRDQVERHALAQWRADERRTALQTWADSDRVHVTTTPEQAHTAMLTTWAKARAQYPDPYDAIERLLMLAHTNTDVNALNTAAQQQLAQAGQLGSYGGYGLRAGGRLRLHIGDQVMTRTNDRTIGVLNGQRGIVTAIESQSGTVTIERRETGPDGPRLVQVNVPRAYIHTGGVQLAYAITAAKAQGLTADLALVYGNGMDAHVLYPAMSRDRERADLWLALDPLETDADRARLGVPGNPAEARQRAVDAYAAAVANDQPDRLVLTELGEEPDPVNPARRQLAQVNRLAADVGRTTERISEQRTVRQQVPDLDALIARVDALPEQQLRQPSDRDLLRERLQRARLDAGGRRAADEQTRQDVMAELREIADGGDPSGRFTRQQLHEGLTVVRAETDRLTRATPYIAGRAEQVPAGARTGHMPWQQRPYGDVPTNQLAAEITRAEQAAARYAAAAAARQQAEQTRLAAARAGQGPTMIALQQQREQLISAVEAARQVEQHRQLAQAEQAKARAARDEIRDLEQAERSRNRVAKLLNPRTEQVAEQVRHLATVAGQADLAGRQAGSVADQHAQIVRRTPNAATRLTALERDWPTRAADAMAADEQPPRTPGMIAAQAFPPMRSQSAEAQSRRAAGLRAEAELRDGLDPGVARREDTSRGIALAQQQREQAARQAADRDHEYDYYRDHHPSIDRGGPELGM